ncbi:MAG: ferritin-like domain-containing protein [Actinomycetota bacterium]|nr:ferritin-like domain-containing protein [Actinomycetota bacterium]MDQ6947156.1 ferritin-like domain-containing protein [Actinomycetota bacterium]
MSVDDRALRSLIDESADLQSDAMRTTKSGLADVVEQGQDRRAAGGIDLDETRAYHIERRRLLATSVKGLGVFAGTAIGVGLYQMFTQPAFADTPMDVQAGQTAASIENLAIKVYNVAAGLPFMKNIPPPAGATVTTFVTMTIKQHTQHAAAFNSAVMALGGKAQNDVDQPVYKGVVTPALPTLKTPLDVVNFAYKLENVAAETYAAETAAVSDKMLRNTFASIMGVEAQHAAVLLAVAALLQGGAPQLITIPPPADKLPAVAGKVGFPNSFYGLDQARAANEGAVQ